MMTQTPTNVEDRMDEKYQGPWADSEPAAVGQALQDMGLNGIDYSTQALAEGHYLLVPTKETGLGMIHAEVRWSECRDQFKATLRRQEVGVR